MIEKRSYEEIQAEKEICDNNSSGNKKQKQMQGETGQEYNSQAPQPFQHLFSGVFQLDDWEMKSTDEDGNPVRIYDSPEQIEIKDMHYFTMNETKYALVDGYLVYPIDLETNGVDKESTPLKAPIKEIIKKIQGIKYYQLAAVCKATYSKNPSYMKKAMNQNDVNQTMNNEQKAMDSVPQGQLNEIPDHLQFDMTKQQLMEWQKKEEEAKLLDEQEAKDKSILRKQYHVNKINNLFGKSTTGSKFSKPIEQF